MFGLRGFICILLISDTFGCQRGVKCSRRKNFGFCDCRGCNRSRFGGMPALVPHDRDAMHAAAKTWLRGHPSTQASSVDRIRRLVEPGARHAYSVLTMVAARSRLGTLGGAIPEPCCLCGEWTHAYCESCRLDDGAPFPVCTTCDGAKAVCPPMFGSWPDVGSRQG